MKKIFLTALGIVALLKCFSQQVPDSSGFQNRKLKVEEINLEVKCKAISKVFHLFILDDNQSPD